VRFVYLTDCSEADGEHLRGKRAPAVTIGYTTQTDKTRCIALSQFIRSTVQNAIYIEKQ